MTPEQKQRAMQMLRRFSQATPMTRTADNAAVAMAALLQELVDADDKFKIGVLAAINAAAPDARHVEVDGQPVFFSKSGDDITDTHTLAPCSHCGGSGAAEDCAPEPEPFGYFKSEPFGWTDCAETDDGAIALYTAPPAPIVSDGWKLVPVEPTPEMMQSASKVATYGALKAAWGRMLEAAPQPESCGWIRAIDEAMVTHHLGVADIADDYEAAKNKLNTLLCLNQDIGEYFSAKAPTPSVPDGHVHVHVSGSTGSGKSAVAGEIEIAMRAIGLDVEWVDSESEKRMTHADYVSALELYKPKVRIFEKNISRAAPQQPKLSDERILELCAEYSKQYHWPLGFARAIEREILGEIKK